MGSEDTLLSNDLTFEMGAGSPPDFAEVCAVASRGEIGEEKPLVEVTGLCDIVRVYRNGLPDGAEFTLTANFIRTAQNGTDAGLRDLYLAYKSDQDKYFRIGVRGSSPLESFDFRAIVRAWNIGGGEPGNPAQLTFTLKIITDIVWTV